MASLWPTDRPLLVVRGDAGSAVVRRQKSGVGLYTLTLVTVPDFPAWIVPMAAHDEQTDVNCGMAVPLQVKVSPPTAGW